MRPSSSQGKNHQVHVGHSKRRGAEKDFALLASSSNNTSTSNSGAAHHHSSLDVQVMDPIMKTSGFGNRHASQVDNYFTAANTSVNSSNMAGAGRRDIVKTSAQGSTFELRRKSQPNPR